VRLFILCFIISIQSFASVRSWFSSLPEESHFQVPNALSDRVNFWIKIYSHYSTTQGVFHLVEDPSVVLGDVDLTEIFEDDKLSAYHKKEMIKAVVQRRKAVLMDKFKIKDPRQVRLQMGLRDRMKKAMYISGKYLDKMETIFKKEGMPIELTRLVFVESSFNVHAQSKVGASGLWQIMPSVAREKGYITAHHDKRNHPIEATKLAASILKQNYGDLKSWPLAITAYNHGLTGVKRMLKRNKADSIDDLIDSDNVTRTWGFASENFYACFLAVLEVERNATELLGEDLVKANALSYKEFKLKSKKPKAEVIEWFDGSLTRFRQMNPHLNWARIKKSKFVPAGVSLMVPRKNAELVKR
jgi:membrane-bound lytic murein transglycosylase D